MKNQTKNKEKKIILDLCGGTGSWSKPYKDAGYDVRKNDYQRMFTNDGIEAEIISFFMADKHMIDNPPDRTKTLNRLVKILKGTGISKITITFLEDNLSHPTGDRGKEKKK